MKSPLPAHVVAACAAETAGARPRLVTGSNGRGGLVGAIGALTITWLGIASVLEATKLGAEA